MMIQCLSTKKCNLHTRDLRVYPYPKRIRGSGWYAFYGSGSSKLCSTRRSLLHTLFQHVKLYANLNLEVKSCIRMRPNSCVYYTQYTRVSCSLHNVICTYTLCHEKAHRIRFIPYSKRQPHTSHCQFVLENTQAM